MLLVGVKIASYRVTRSFTWLLQKQAGTPPASALLPPAAHTQSLICSEPAAQDTRRPQHQCCSAPSLSGSPCPEHPRCLGQGCSRRPARLLSLPPARTAGRCSSCSYTRSPGPAWKHEGSGVAKGRAVGPHSSNLLMLVFSAPHPVWLGRRAGKGLGTCASHPLHTAGKPTPREDAFLRPVLPERWGRL